MEYKDWVINATRIIDMEIGQQFIDITGNCWIKTDSLEVNDNLVWAKSMITGRTDCFAACAEGVMVYEETSFH